MTRTIYKEKIPSTDPRLKRHVHHDSKSLEYAFDTTGLQIADVVHNRNIPIFDQGQVGSCTGNAGLGCINTSPFVAPEFPTFLPSEDGALALYSAAEMIDGDGPYPPNDHGSSGLSIAKVLLNTKMISGYQHTFTLNDALKALTKYPILTGVNWYEDMFTPDADGRVHPTGALAGGHEFVATQIDAENGRIWFDNSWGKSWGVNGRFYMTWADYASLLAKNGDVTVLIPNTVTPPAPAPIPTVTDVTIKRGADNGVETMGTLTVTKSDGSTWMCDTLELSWKNNQHNISCIPVGSYQCKLAPLGTFNNQPFYELQNVPNRTGIFIHPANYDTQLLGCIALGIKPSDINHDGQLDVTSSVATVASFIKTLGSAPFTVHIQ